MVSYEDKKAYFERGVAQVGNDGFAVAGPERVSLLKASRFKAAYGGVGYSGDVPAPGKKRPELFIDRWLRDPDRRIVDRMTYVPYAVIGRRHPPSSIRSVDSTARSRHGPRYQRGGSRLSSSPGAHWASSSVEVF